MIRRASRRGRAGRAPWLRSTSGPARCGPRARRPPHCALDHRTRAAVRPIRIDPGGTTSAYMVVAILDSAQGWRAISTRPARCGRRDALLSLAQRHVHRRRHVRLPAFTCRTSMREPGLATLIVCGLQTDHARPHKSTTVEIAVPWAVLEGSTSRIRDGGRAMDARALVGRRGRDCAGMQVARG